MASFGHQAISTDARARARGRGRAQKRTDGWENWGGYGEAKKQKLKTQFSEEAPNQLKKEGSGSKIFAGISIYVNGYTKPSSDELKRLMMLHGGNYEHYLYRTKVTHVIATNLPDSKVRELKGLKVVRPEWITDSIKAGKLLSYTTYQLYTAKSGRQQGLSGFTVKQNSTDSSTISDLDIQSVHENGLDLGKDKIDLEMRNLDFMDTHSTDSCSERLNSNQNNPDFHRDVSVESMKQHDVKTNSDKTLHKRETHMNTDHSPAKAGDPKFINEFYNNSRLHHLSTWKAEYRDYVNHLQTMSTGFPGHEKLRQIVLERDNGSDTDLLESSGVNRGKPKKCVMHIDMDCFFVSVGLRRRPDLKGKPIAVTHSKGKGASPSAGSDLDFEKKQWELKGQQVGKKGKKTPVGQQAEDETNFPDLSDSDIEEEEISPAQHSVKTQETFHSMAEIASCSYEARKAGVKNGMFMGRAKQICPDLVTIPYDFEGYQTVSKALYDTVASYTHDIEAVSCDEMLVDCTDLLSNTGATPLEFATLLRQEIYEKTKCTASAGLASNILLAKMATRKAKPNGQFHLTDTEVQDFIAPQSVHDIPGVGWSMTKKLENMKVCTCGELQRVSLDSLQREFGPKTGQSLYRYCRGQDDRRVQTDHQRKSVSAEVNYGIRFTTDAEAIRFLQELSEEVCQRLKNIHMKGKSVTLKLMVRREDAPTETAKFLGHGICNNLSKSVSLPLATDDAKIVGKEVVTILRQQRAAPEDLRGIGIQIQKLEPAEEGTRAGGSKTQSILNFTVNKAQTSKQNSDTGSKELASSSFSKESVCVSSRNGDLMRDKCSNELSRRDSLDGQSEICDNVIDLSDRRGVDQSERTSLQTDQSDASAKDGKRAMNWASENLIDDLVRRQVSSSQLPPLPIFPDIPTPESGRKRLFKPSAPAVQENQSEDYFPSPSQVDPAVLQELPPDIREQIQKEMESRKVRKKPSTSLPHRRATLAESSGAEQGCSHWDAGNVQEVGRTVVEKSRDVIEALPSPSQIDMTCLSALPPSLQKEITEAYAKQDSRRKDLIKENNPLRLNQAESPSKPANKRSPAKSPQFKVPKNKQSGRGKKKVTSSKKLLFNEQKMMASSSFIVIDQNANERVITEGACDRLEQQDTRKQDLSREAQTEAVTGNSAEIGVNLCGAVEIAEVRSLIKEWICSTPEPQDEDEEVIIDYLEKLILDKNLEQVDLVLKYMYRNIDFMKSKDWLLALKRIFTQTQAVVKSIYGGTLKSIPVL